MTFPVDPRKPRRHEDHTPPFGLNRRLRVRWDRAIPIGLTLLFWIALLYFLL